MARGTPLEPDSDMATLLQACQERIGYQFQNQDILREALTHASSADRRLDSNERLEFLGDSVLGLVVCEMLFHRYPQFSEGDLTRIKSAVVSRHACARLSRRLGLADFLILGRGMTLHAAVPHSALADVFEALIGAMFVDGGIQVASDFVQRHIAEEIDSLSGDGQRDNYKSRLQQYAQREFGSIPVYQLLDEQGPDHSKCFKIAVRLGPHRYSPAWGPTKKEAEQHAAQNALAQLHGEPPPFISD